MNQTNENGSTKLVYVYHIYFNQNRPRCLGALIYGYEENLNCYWNFFFETHLRMIMDICKTSGKLRATLSQHAAYG
jgi:hypothetical protein